MDCEGIAALCFADTRSFFFCFVGDWKVGEGGALDLRWDRWLVATDLASAVVRSGSRMLAGHWIPRT